MIKKHRLDVRVALAGFPLFANLPGARLAELAGASRLVKVGKGETIYRAGEPPRELFLLLTGHVKRATVSRGGNEKVLDLVFPGQCFGEAELLSGRPYGAFSIAVETSYLVCLDGAAVDGLFDLEPRFARNIVGVLAARQAHLERDMAANHFRTGCERVLDYLLDHAGKVPSADGQTMVDLPSSKHLIASRLGIAPETLSRSLRELSDKGLIAMDGRFILLRNAAVEEFLTQSRGTRHPGRQDSASHPVRSGGDDAGKGAMPDLSPLRAVNVSGRQRMLSQRLAKSWLLLGQGVQPGRSRAMLRQSAELFESQLTVLNRLEAGEELSAARAELARAWMPYKALLACAPNRDAADRLFDLNERVLAAAQEATLALERAAAPPRARLVHLPGRPPLLSPRVATRGLCHEGEGR
ncbi:MAG: cyclic nucleotide-binding domain-containing protein, partial [Rhodocyclaceae bacterium]|nr:cyclic nucleotide-binding domain-containing protein [Rhodocyclaceae bacterium]